MKKLFFLLLLIIIGAISCKEGPTDPPIIPPPIKPSIIIQPMNVTVTAPATATFSVTATGTAPLSYQWQKNGANIVGATSASYTLLATSVADSGSAFRCIVSNTAGNAISNSALLVVIIAPVAPIITVQSVSVTVTAPATATFSVTATGTAPLSYQWQKNGANIVGATSASYTTPATSVADSGSAFRCIVSNTAGNAISNSAVLTVLPQIIGLGNFYQGGIIFYLNNTGQHGLIAATSDQPRANWEDAKKNCNDLILNDYDDWFLPDIEQLKLLWAQRNLVGSFVPTTFWDDGYWSATLSLGPDSLNWAEIKRWYTPPSTPTASVVGFKTDIYNVRAIRKF